jgi:hypothetical protein
VETIVMAATVAVPPVPVETDLSRTTRTDNNITDMVGNQCRHLRILRRDARDTRRLSAPSTQTTKA